MKSTVLIKNNVPLIKDFIEYIKNFYRVNSHMTAGEAAQAFRTRWAGYREYDEKFIESVFKIVME
jgi:hypothetical protein